MSGASTESSGTRERPMLQLALDAPEHLALLPRLREHFDIIEVGTPLLKRFGLAAITTVRELGGGRQVLADTKTADGGALEAAMVCGAGASMMTVLAHASAATRDVAVATAAQHGATVIFDTIIDGEFDTSVLPTSGSDGDVWLALHHASDARLAGYNSNDHITRVAQRKAAGFRVSLAGGIGRSNIAEVLDVAPDIIVIGSAVTGATNPEEEAAWLSSTVAQTHG